MERWWEIVWVWTWRPLVSDYYHIRTVDVSRGLGVFGEEVATALDPAVPHDADGVHDQVAATIRLPCGLVRG